MFAMKIGRNGKGPKTAPHDPAFSEILRLLFHKKHSPRADQQEGAEEIENKVEAIDQRHAEPDHYPAHHKRADNSPYQSAMLRHRRHAKIGKDQNENENIIDAKGVLDHVAGQKFERFV